MAIYFDYAMNHIQPISPELDPTTDLMVWLHDKVADWANKTSAQDAVRMCTGPANWQAANQPLSTQSPCQVAFKLNGVGYAKGGDVVQTSHNIVGFEFGGYSTAPFYVNKQNYPRLIDESLGWQDPSNYAHEVNWGSLQNDNMGIRTLYTANYGLTPSEFNTPKTSHVLYSDKPGDEWFYMQLRDRDTIAQAMSCLVHRITPPADYPDNFDPGWAVTFGTQSYPMINFHQFDNTSWSTNRQYARNNDLVDNENVGYSVNSYFRALKLGFSLADNNGTLAGVRDDFIISPLDLTSMATYDLKGTKYIALTRRLLLPYESFE